MLQDFIGFGSLGEALGALDKAGYGRFFIVASENGWRRFPCRDFFGNKNLHIFSRFSPNPDFREIIDGMEECRRFNPDLLIAIGGGSSMDVAKAIKAAAHTHENYNAAQPDGIKPSGEGPPLIAVATTAGSGAEATQYAIFYVGDTKYSLSHPSLRPEAAVVDPELTYSLPPGQTAATGFDALAQAIEAFWAADSTHDAKEYARSAIRYAVPHILKAVISPDTANRYNMSMSAYFAGKAINVTRTTCPHALGYHLTKRYGLSHGHAVSLTLPYFFIINVDPDLETTIPGGREVHMENMQKLFAMLGQLNAEDSFAFWRDLMKKCGLVSTFAEAGLTSRGQIRELVSTINPDRLKNHPVALTPDYLVDAFSQR